MSEQKNLFNSYIDLCFKFCYDMYNEKHRLGVTCNV